jgi:Ca-activated chloride channel family protein
VAATAGIAQEATTEPLEESESTSVVLLMDASGSMNADAGTGTSKIEVARDAVGGVLDSLPSSAEVGLRVFGGGTEQQQGCQDTRAVFPVGPVDAEAMKAQLEEYVPGGSTPIALALRLAARDLPPGDTRAIVLVSDGKDSCAPPDPCTVAEDIVDEGIDVRIEAIGFQVNAAARRELQCIARVGGGIYRDAEDAEELGQELETISVRALRRYEPEGTPIAGGRTRREATEVEPGQYVDSMQPGEERWYAISLARGEALTAAATLVPPRRAVASVGSSFGISIFNPNLAETITPGTQTTANLFVGEGEGIASVGAYGLPVGFRGDQSAEFAREEKYGEAGTYHIQLDFEDDATKELTDEANGLPFAVELLVDVPARETDAELPVGGTSIEAPSSETEENDGIDALWLLLVAGLLGAAGLAGGAALVRRGRSAP